MSEARTTPDIAMRIVLEVTSEDGSVFGTLTTDGGKTRSFWGWLELMSALEVATGAAPAVKSATADEVRGATG